MPGPHSDPFEPYSDPARYDRALAEALAVAGESKEFFARGRVETTRALARELGARTDAVLDFGCGAGDTLELLKDALAASRVVGVDPSHSTIELARQRHPPRPGVALLHSEELVGAAAPPFDLCYTNGVFHHIRPEERPQALTQIRDALAPGGRLFLWENHAGNPGTRFVMARCAFDDDAIPLWPGQARRMLKRAGFVVERTAYRFLFPRSLAFLRPLERRLLAALPVGAQYVVVARR